MLDTLRKGVQARRQRAGPMPGLNRQFSSLRDRQASQEGERDFNDVAAFPSA